MTLRHARDEHLRNLRSVTRLTCRAGWVCDAGFGHGEKALGAAKAKEVIEETHGFYKNLMAGKSEAGKLWLK